LDGYVTNVLSIDSPLDTPTHVHGPDKIT
jgi:hypothetical protein